MAVMVNLARDARIHHSLFPDTDLYAELTGRIVNSWRRSSKIIFLSFRDVSGTIQLVADKSALEKDFKSFADLPSGANVRVVGPVRRTKRGKISVFPSSPPDLLDTPNIEGLIEEQFSGVGAQIMLSRLETSVRSTFKELGFTEITPRYISSTWHNEGLQPLNVIFPGQSRNPFHLAVSPVPQLVRATIAMAGIDFFAISRCFATNFIATQNGAESVVAGALSVSHDFNEMINIMETALDELVSGYETALEPETLIAWRAGISNKHKHQAVDAKARNLYITKNLNLHGPGDFPIRKAFQLKWGDRMQLAEGYELSIAKEDTVVLLIYVERFLRLLGSQDNRRIRDVSEPMYVTENTNDEH